MKEERTVRVSLDNLPKNTQFKERVETSFLSEVRYFREIFLIVVMCFEGESSDVEY